jgi:hypothetical protein
MRRVLYISLILYLPLLLASAAIFFGDFRTETLGSSLFQALFMLWVLDGFVCLVSGISAIRAVYTEIFSSKKNASLAALSLIAVLFGIPPAYILVEIASKLARYLIN